MILLPNTLKFFVEKMREAFALQKLLTFFNKKYWQILDIDVWKFNEMLTNDIVSFEQPGPGLWRGLAYTDVDHDNNILIG